MPPLLSLDVVLPALWVSLFPFVNDEWSCLAPTDRGMVFTCGEWGTEGHDVQRKCCTKTGFPLLNGKAPSFRKRTQSICSNHTCQVDSKVPSPEPFTGLSNLPGPLLTWLPEMSQTQHENTLYRKHAANSMSRSSLRA